MKIEIFDVELGQCAMVHCPNGKKVMIDAGHNASIPWYPSVHFKGQGIDRFIISNFDEDHVSDFVDLRKNCKIKLIHKNHSVSPAALKDLKDGIAGMGVGIRAVYDWMNSPPGTGVPADLEEVEAVFYYNEYGTFDDTNNLSVATFFHYEDFTILFPGDLEVEGWEELLKFKNFQNDLSKVDIFVASHHGRENGYCPEVFDYCEPTMIIISDGSIKHATQEKTTGWYEKKASGLTSKSGKNRSVLTTRKDGHITIDADSNGDFNIKMRKET